AGWRRGCRRRQRSRWASRGCCPAGAGPPPWSAPSPTKPPPSSSPAVRRTSTNTAAPAATGATPSSKSADDRASVHYSPGTPSASANCRASRRQTGWTVNRASLSLPKRSARCLGFAGGSALSTETSSRGYDPSIWLRRASKLCPECTITRRSVSVRMKDATRASARSPKTVRERSPLGSRVHSETSTCSPGSSEPSTAFAMRCANPFFPKTAIAESFLLSGSAPGRRSSRCVEYPGHRAAEADELDLGRFRRRRRARVDGDLDHHAIVGNCDVGHTGPTVDGLRDGLDAASLASREQPEPSGVR